MAKKYWLMKSEPEVYSIDDLKKQKTCLWEGVRNYQARNFMMKDMSPGDEILFYHSNAMPPGVAGVAIVGGPAEPDPTAQNPKSEYHDPKATKENPIWFCVPVKFSKAFSQIVALDEIRKSRACQKMLLLKRGMRLSVQPVSEAEFKAVCQMAESSS